MPAQKLAEHFDPTLGRPTKDLYSIAGMLFIMEFRNWTHDEAAGAPSVAIQCCANCG